MTDWVYKIIYSTIKINLKNDNKNNETNKEKNYLDKTTVSLPLFFIFSLIQGCCITWINVIRVSLDLRRS